MWQWRTTVAPPPVRKLPSLGYPGKGALGEHREALRAETPVRPECQTALPGRASNSSGPDLPRGNQGREDDNSDTSHRGGGVGGFGGDSAAARGGNGQDKGGEEGGPGPP